MTDWQVIADRDNGDDPQAEDLRDGDRYTLCIDDDDDIIYQILRPVPSIADMAPGTTFIAKSKGSSPARRFMKTVPYFIDEFGDGYTALEIDQSTVRDVQEPPALPEDNA